jgi:hypothetical protein
MIADMYRYCNARAVPYRTYSLPRRKSGLWDHIIWCFADPIGARTFHRKFGGERINVTDYYEEA